MQVKVFHWCSPLTLPYSRPPGVQNLRGNFLYYISYEVLMGFTLRNWGVLERGYKFWREISWEKVSSRLPVTLTLYEDIVDVHVRGQSRQSADPDSRVGRKRFNLRVTRPSGKFSGIFLLKLFPESIIRHDLRLPNGYRRRLHLLSTGQKCRFSESELTPLKTASCSKFLIATDWLFLKKKNPFF